ncbi:MAG: phosphatidylglycerophosphatase A [Pseudomonadota bacterium]
MTKQVTNKKDIRNKAKVFSNADHFLAFGFGSGLSPFAPGTMGTLAAIPLYLIMVLLLPQWMYITLTIVFLVIGIGICDRVSNDLQTHDFSGIVWDEIVGYLITMMFLPLSWELILLGFLLFRFFDILKPWPISWLDKELSGGLGIMLDDVLAGIFAWVILMLISHFWLSTAIFPILS